MPCDVGDYSVIVDAHGHFVGQLAPGTGVVATVAPGEHVFFGWSSIDLRDGRCPQLNPVAAVRVNTAVASTSCVALIVRQRGSTLTRCDRHAAIDMLVVGEASPVLENASDDPTRLLPPDYVLGQAMLDAHPAMLRSYTELGRAKLILLDYYRDEERRRAAECASENR